MTMRRRAFALQHVGIAAAVFGLSKLHAVVHIYDFTASSRFAWSFAYAALLAVSAYGAGLPEVPRGRSRLLTATGAVAVAAVVISLAQLVLGSALLPRFVVLGAGAVLVPWFALVSALARDGDERAGARDRVLVVAGSGDSEALVIDFEARRERPAVIVACLTPARVAAVRTALVDAMRAHEATVLVLARDALDDPRVVAQASELHEAGVRVRSLIDFYAEWLGKLPIGELERSSLLFDVREVHEPRYARTKRLIDLAVAVPGLVVLALAVPFVAAGNRAANRGPLFYRQPRVGRNGRVFSILKFRTMAPHDDALLDEWTGDDDPRITRFGRVLRRTHLDELPQVVNVVRGDLAIVGPRPEQPHYVEELADKLPFYQLRHLVRPGITGWAQVTYGYAGSERDALEKLQYEFFYLGTQSLRFDLQIMGRTIRSVLGGDGR